jgi:hypothetical protein
VRLVYLDSVICIYAVEGAQSFQIRAKSRLAAMRAAADQPAISDLTWLECRVKPIRLADPVALADMEAFLNASDVVRLPMSPGGVRAGLPHSRSLQLQAGRCPALGGGRRRRLRIVSDQ